MRIHKFRPEVFPEVWASDWGEDEYGLWMAFTCKGIKQTFRWIEPGTFLMGSPIDERERVVDEIQHQVTLTQGFWLADTTCTQALWKAITNDNPSHFKGNNRPVERISWEDTQGFINKVNLKKPELQLCLPSEAQWEYACRAGTTTPFSWGNTISSDLVNYDGNYPYANGEKGLYREQTVGVKSLPPNQWGLYEMHGNVWEWCADYWQHYPKTPVTDPAGPERGVSRVLRGGSWINFGRLVRSAYRNHYSPDYRSIITGFRLARGHSVPVK